MALTSLNCSKLLAPNEFTISTFRRTRSDLVRSPGPETGQILALFCTRRYCPGTSTLNLTRYQPPSLTIVPAWPERRDIDLPLRRCSAVAGGMVSASWSQVNGIKAFDSVGSGSTTAGVEETVMRRRRVSFRQPLASAGPPCFSVDGSLDRM